MSFNKESKFNFEMETLYLENINKIKQNKEKLEKALKVKISYSRKDVVVNGDAINEYVALLVIESIDLGFTAEQALLLCNEDFVFEKINIKDITKRHDLERVRGRIIGTKGKTKNLLETLSDCFICLHDNIIGIIGRAEDIEKAMAALTSIIQGAKQSKVYSQLERMRSKEKLKMNEDLGLKNKEKP